MRKFLLAIAAPFFVDFCGPPTVEQTEVPKPRIEETTEASVIRVDMGQRFRGSGVVVSKAGYVVTALDNLPEYVFWKYQVTLGAEHVPGRIVAVDKKLGLALIRSSRPLSNPVTFIVKPVPKETDPAVVVVFSETDGEPPLLSKGQYAAEVSSVHERAESLEGLDLRDMMTVSLRSSPNRMHRGGGAVFLPKPDRFIGIIIGSTTHDSNSYENASSPVIVVPAPVVSTFLRAHGVAPVAK